MFALDSTAYEIINKIPYVASDNYKPYTYNTIEINFNNQVQKQINIEVLNTFIRN
ncbi:MAG: hypothetical protein IPF63_12905 [Bacteroidetes bacterium]|nr:hypothetical protein [Bacteroidota bacterium]